MTSKQDAVKEEVDLSTLKAISFLELRDMKISLGDLYWKKSSGKFVKVLNCGDYTLTSRIEKFEKVTPNLFIDRVCNEDFIKKGSEIISNILNSVDEVQRLSLRDQFISHIRPVFWQGNESGSVLDLIKVFQNALYNIDRSFEEEMEANAFVYHRRSILSATLITLLAICSGYTHGDFLKDLYNICHFFDYSLAKEGNDLENPKHIRKSRELLIDSKLYSPRNVNLSRLIEFHHELLNEQGSILKLNTEEIGDLERIIIWVENVLPYSIEEYRKDDGRSFLNKIINVSEHQEAFIDVTFKEKLLTIFGNEETGLEQVA